jgi:hypothetical protein
MNSPKDAPADTSNDADVDPIDEEAADIDARSEDAPEKIQQLIDDAEALGRPVSQDVDPDAGGRGGGAGTGRGDDDDDEPEVLPG